MSCLTYQFMILRIRFILRGVYYENQRHKYLSKAAIFLKFIMPVLYSFMHYVTREIMLQRKLLFTQKDLIRQDGFHYKHTCPNTHVINQRKTYLSKLSLYFELCSTSNG